MSSRGSGLEFREVTEKDKEFLCENYLWFADSRFHLIINEGVIVGVINFTITSNKAIKIEQITIMREFRRKGLGTKTVLYLREQYKGFDFFGDILYPIAFEFWSSLRFAVNYYHDMERFDDVFGEMSFEFC